jgi:hypothetical protein
VKRPGHLEFAADPLEGASKALLLVGWKLELDALEKPLVLGICVLIGIDNVPAVAGNGMCRGSNEARAVVAAEK